MNEPQHTAGGPTESRPGGPGDLSRCEPALLRYVCLLWRYRWVVFGGSVLPAVLVALALYLWPQRYAATFFYERPLAESEYGVLLRRFHSQENLDKIIGRLRGQGLTRFIRRLDRARTRQSFDKLIRFDVAPMYPKRLQTTDPCTSEKISGFRAKLLSIKVFGSSQEEVTGVSAVVTGNLESVLPLYDVRNHLKETMAKLREEAAKIEDGRFKLTADLQKEQAKLAKLKTLGDAPGEATPGGAILQFNVDTAPPSYPSWSGPIPNANRQETLSSSAGKYSFYEFLPLPYQTRAAQSRIVDLQETLANNTSKYNFYLQVLEIDNQLLAKIEESLLTYYTAQEYLTYLRAQLSTYGDKDPAVSDHLKSYIRKTENLVQANTRAGEKPVVYPVSKDIVSRSALAFLLFLMIATFAAVLLEYRRQSHLLLEAVLRSGRGPKPGVTTPGSVS